MGQAEPWVERRFLGQSSAFPREVFLLLFLNSSSFALSYYVSHEKCSILLGKTMSLHAGIYGLSIPIGHLNRYFS